MDMSMALRTVRAALVAVGLFTSLHTSPAAASTQSAESAVADALEEFASTLRREADSSGLGGISAAVMLDGRIIWEQGFGWADAGARLPATAETVYRIGSITKSVTAVAMMMLSQAERLDLDQPVADHLPEIRRLVGYDERKPITFRQVASHTAGLVREPDLEDAARGPLADWERKLIESISKTSFIGNPGAQYAYSNIGYGILGLAISRAADRPYMDLVTELILEPTPMTSSSFTKPDHTAVGYGNWDPDAPVNTELPAVEHEGRGYKVPNGGLYSTAGDLLRFVREMTPRARAGLLSAAARAEMLTVHSPLGIGEVYGLGFILTPGRVGSSVDRLAWHDGAVAGYSAMVMVHPESATGIAWLRNYNRGTLDLDDATNRLIGRLIQPRR